MVFAYGLQVAKNFQLIDDSSDKTLTLLPCGGLKVRAYMNMIGLRTFPTRPISTGPKTKLILPYQSSFIAIAVSIVGILTYTIYVTFWCKTKSQCNDIHPYISAFPIIGFIVLRNIPGNVLECPNILRPL